MAVASVRFNTKEEKILKILKKEYKCDTSALIKKSLWDLYEDISDKEAILEFEKKSKNNRIEFLTIDDLLVDKK